MTNPRRREDTALMILGMIFLFSVMIFVGIMVWLVVIPTF